VRLVRSSIITGSNYERRIEKCHLIIDLAWILLRLVTGVAGVWGLRLLLGAAASAF
jgi:retron-type reverse transcriptase